MGKLTKKLPVYDELKVAAELRKLGFIVVDTFEWEEDSDAGVELENGWSFQLCDSGGICVNHWNGVEGTMTTYAEGVLFNEAVAKLKEVQSKEVAYA